MSKKNKRKKCVQNRKPLISQIAITKNYFDDYVKRIHKLLLLAGLEPSLFDALSKRTKMHFMKFRHTPFRICAEKDNTVPRYYLKFFNRAMTYYEKTSFYGDPKFNFTFLEYVTYGLSFIMTLRHCKPSEDRLPLDQFELLDKIKVPLLKYVAANTDDHYAVRTNFLMKSLFMYVTQPNYRYYTCKESGVANMSKARVDNLITVSSFEPERKNFFIDGELHSSYRLGYYLLGEEANDLNPVMAEIPMQLLEEKNSTNMKQIVNQIKTTITLPVYIQNHALHRFAERMDNMNNMFRNTIFSVSFMVPGVVTSAKGQRLIRAMHVTGKNIGYFPFIKQDGAILLLSFLPLASPITPEGSLLHKELKLQLEDSKYIGLDKLSFYTKTDFDTVPILRDALKKAGMWHLTEIEPETPTEKKEDQILKNFFQYNYDIIEQE